MSRVDTGAHLLTPWRFELADNLSTNSKHVYNKPRIRRIQVDRQTYPTYAKIRLMRNDIKGFGTIVPKILSEICEDPTYARY